MFAVIKTGGKQYRVTRDQIITVEKLAGDAGATVEFDEILAIGDDGNQTIGTPHIDGAGVRGAIVEQSRADKIIVFKKKRRKNYRRKMGHRQDQTAIRITEIVAEGFKKGAAKTAPAEDTKPTADVKSETAKPEDSKTPAARESSVKASAAKATAAKETAAQKTAADTNSVPKAK